MDTKQAKKIFADAHILRQQIEADLKVLRPAVGDWNYTTDKRMYILRIEDLKRFLKVYATTQDKTMLKFYVEAKDLVDRLGVWYPQNLQRTEKEYVKLIKVYEQILTNPFSPIFKQKIGEYQLLTMEERKGLRAWKSKRNKEISALDRLAKNILVTRNANKKRNFSKGGDKLAGVLLNASIAKYATQFVKEIKIIKIVHTAEEFRKGTKPYIFSNPITTFQLKVKMYGDNKTYKFFYEDRSMTGGARTGRQPYEGQVYKYELK